MIFYKDKKIKKQIESDCKELENYKNSYSKRISLYNTYIETMPIFEDGIVESNNLNKEDMENKKQVFQEQINIIDSNLELLASLLKNIDSTDNAKTEKKVFNKYNENYKEIRKNYINNSIFEDQITEKYINRLMADLTKTNEKTKEEHGKEIEIEKKEDKEIHIKNNNTLLISEKQGKVILPYTGEEVLRIFNTEENKYSSVEEVIEDKFTRNFSDYKMQFASRYTETIKLVRERENYNLIDSITIATEMMKKRLLHPAIISACRTLNELDVYLDCLDKNELDDFKIFKVKYELYPMVVKQNCDKKEKIYTKYFNSKIWTKIKNIVRKNKTITNEIIKK